MRLIDVDEFKRENERMLNCDFPYISEETLGELIDKAPTIDPVKHGRWMGTVCSVCGESFSEYYDCKFCPNCGAYTMEDYKNG